MISDTLPEQLSANRFIDAKEEISGRKVASIGRVVFVAIDDQGQPVPHSVTVDD